jgi:sugar phosphate isomerase/epimerase
MNRRRFLLSTGLFLAVGVAPAVARPAAKTLRVPRRHSDRVAFNTANLVARFTGYRYELRNWGEQHQRTVAATDERAWNGMCADIAEAGFTAVEIWEAHASPETMNAPKARVWRQILDDYGLRPIAYAGGLRRETLQICQWLGIPQIAGGLRGLTAEEATTLCIEYRVAFNYENHPERTVEEILKPIGGGNRWLGVCVDTGWLATQRAFPPEIIRALGPLVRHTHIKDVKKAGAHETCRLGDGVAAISASVTQLKKMNYPGWYSWEDEPEDRNPLDLARWSRNYLERLLR